MLSNNYRNTRVLLLRHGQSTYNALGLYQGSSDRSNLTDLGRQQAQLTGEFFKEIKFDAIYCSPLQRAQDTAIEVLKTIDPTVVPNSVDTVPNLRETDLPAWQGLPFQFVKEQFPEDYRTWKQRPHEFRMEIPFHVGEEEGERGRGGEKGIYLIQNRQYCFPALDLYDRIQQFWQEILPRHIGQTILIVCHGGTNRALISTALGVSPAYYHCIEQSNCALSILNFPNGCLESGKLEAMNCTFHVGENFPKLKEGSSGLQLFLVPTDTENSERIEQISYLIKYTTINFSICGDLDKSRTISDRILQNHPTAVQFQVLREDFPQLWQQAINAKNQSNSQPLLTGLVVASDRAIQQFLGQVLGMNDDQLWRLNPHPGTLSIVHYPDSEHPPILQAMNLGI
jgi:probable phosphoglycerate mutase